MTKKFFLASILSIAMFAVGCNSIPRVTVLEAKPEKQTFKLELCGVEISVPANFKVENHPTALTTFHVVKDDIDIVAAPNTESDIKKIETNLPKESEEFTGAPMKVNRVAPSKINGLEAVSLFGVYTKDGKTESIDIDVIKCATGKGALMFYTLSPVKTYRRDRAIVVELFNSTKPLPEFKKKK
ncbi:MAG: hypothetical protein KDK36_04010 [Leptospiraceae bacterium]|nr:hypothetical protein [Leptospiraceae bacterium]